METRHIFSKKKRKSSSKQETEWDHQLSSRFLCRTSFEVNIQSSDVQKEDMVIRNHQSPLMSSNRVNHDQNGQGNEADSENDKTTSTQRSDQDSKSVSLSSLSSESSSGKLKTSGRSSNFSEAESSVEKKRMAKRPNGSQLPEHLSSHSCSVNGEVGMGENGLFSNKFTDSKSNLCNKRNFSLSSGKNHSPKKNLKDFSSFRMNSDILTDIPKNDLAAGDYVQSEIEENRAKITENSQLNKLSGIFSTSLKDINKQNAEPLSEESAYSNSSLKNDYFLNKSFDTNNETFKDSDNIHPLKLHQIFINKESESSSSKSDGGENYGKFTVDPISNSHQDLKGIYTLRKPQVNTEQKSDSFEGGGSLGDFTRNSLGPISGSPGELKGIYNLSKPLIKSAQESDSSEGGESLGFDMRAQESDSFEGGESLGFDTRAQEFPMQSSESSSFDTDTGRESIATSQTYHSGENSDKWKISVSELVEYFENLNSETDLREKNTKTEPLVEFNFACDGSEARNENFLDSNKNQRELLKEERCLNNSNNGNNATWNLTDSVAQTCNTFNLNRRYFNNDCQSKSSDLLYQKEARKIRKCEPVDDHDKNVNDLMDCRKYGFHHRDKLKKSTVHSVPKVDILHFSTSESNIPLLQSQSKELETEHSKESTALQTANDNTQTDKSPLSVPQETSKDQVSYSSWRILGFLYLIQYLLLLLYR